MKKRNLVLVGIILTALLVTGFFEGTGFFGGKVVSFAASAEENSGQEADGRPVLPEEKIGSGWKAADGKAADLGFTYLAMENGNFAFYINEDGNFGILDKRNKEWYLSIPTQEDRDADTVAKAVNKVGLGSDYQLIFIDQKGSTSVKNTLAAAVNKGSLRLTEAEDGVKVWYYFPDNEVTFSVYYQLTEDGFLVSIPFDDILEHIEEGKVAEDKDTVSYWGIRDIGVLPYFGAAGLEDEGYLLIPDGSGALIHFNNQKSSYSTYAQEVYGRDSVLNLVRNLKTAENVLMPVFGASFGDHGFFAVAEEGAASASINAASSGTLTSYNNVYAKFTYHQSMSANTSVKNNYGGSRTLTSTVVVDNQYSEGGYKIRYFLLEEDKADYVGMAECYRDYLIAKGLTKKASADEAYLSVTLYGGIEDTAYFLGIPYKTVTKLTSYEEVQGILEELNSGGVDHLVVRYCGWQKDGLESAIPTKVKFESVLGGEKKFQSLMKYADSIGAKIFLDLDFLNFYQSGNSYSIYGDSIQAATQDTAYQYTYDPNTGNYQEKHRWQLLTPNSSVSAFEKLIQKKDKLYTGCISLGAVGSTLYSDFTARANAINRDDTLGLWSKMVQTADANFDSVMVETGNIYAAMYADYIDGVTSKSSDFDLADEAVPFYQIVLHGYVSYGTEPINLTADPDKAVLKALETGSNLSFSLLSGDSYELVDTRYNFLYNASYDSWGEVMQEYYAKAEPILSAVSGYAITGHEKVSENVYRTDYGEAGSVYVNYGKKDITIDGITVAAGSYIYLDTERR